jgi:hypothetical protein
LEKFDPFWVSALPFEDEDEFEDEHEANLEPGSRTWNSATRNA